MAKFNIEVELDWVDEEAGYTIDEEIKEQVVRGVKDIVYHRQAGIYDYHEFAEDHTDWCEDYHAARSRTGSGNPGVTW